MSFFNKILGLLLISSVITLSACGGSAGVSSDEGSYEANSNNDSNDSGTSGGVSGDNSEGDSSDEELDPEDVDPIDIYPDDSSSGTGDNSDSSGSLTGTGDEVAGDSSSDSGDQEEEESEVDTPPSAEDDSTHYQILGYGNTDGSQDDDDDTPAITTIYIKEMSGSASGSSNTPITFGQIFKRGDIEAGKTISATLDTEDELEIQVDKKATYDDGSLKHAIITTFIPQLDQDEKARIYLNSSEGSSDNTPLNLMNLLGSDYDAEIIVNISGTNYSASATELLSSEPEKLWLSGQTVTEWLVSSPLKDDQGNAHPHLQARFNVRAYKNFNHVRTSVILENIWAYEENPSNFTYDLEIKIAGETALQQSSVKQFHHSRFRRVFWYGDEPQISTNYKTSYLKETKAVPNYDPDVTITESRLEEMVDEWEEDDKSELMNIGTLKSYMPGTGAREDYGLLPGWTANYIVSQDDRAKNVMLGNAEQAGTWSIHYRDKDTDQPLSIDDYPYCGLYGSSSDKYNHELDRAEVFPECVDCYGSRAWAGKTANDVSVADSSHQPSIAYLPYIITGDHYHLEEQLFWASYNLIQANPGYREHEKGIVAWDQTRGQAWSLRTLAQTAFIIPDDHPMKGYFTEKLNNNRDWYQANYIDDTEEYAYANDIGWIGYAWNDDPDGENFGIISPWMNDFFTASIGHAIDLGFTNWQSVMQWQGQFPVGRLYGTEFCSTMATSYLFAIGSDRYGPYYDWKDLYEATAVIEAGEDILNYECGSAEMMDYLSEVSGYDFYEGMLYEKYLGSAANYMTRYQGALSYSVDHNVTNAEEAWDIFINREAATDYTDNPRYAILPREE